MKISRFTLTLIACFISGFFNPYDITDVRGYLWCFAIVFVLMFTAHWLIPDGVTFPWPKGGKGK